MKIINDLKHNKKIALEKTDYLKKGKYVLLPNMRTYVHKDKYKEALSHFPGGVKSKAKLLFYKILRCFFAFKIKNTGEFNGEALYFSTVPNPAYRDCKVFSYDKEKVAIFCANRKRFDLYMKNRNRNNMFPLPNLCEINEESLYVCEEFFCYKENIVYNFKELLHSLFDFYFNYYEKCNDLKESLHSLGNEELLCQDVKVEECPTLYLHHADLSIDNLIYCKKPSKRIVFIDFDHENYYPPFYDIFFLMFNQLISNNNGSMIELFNSGIYDKYLCRYSEDNNLSLKNILTGPIKFLWYKRMQSYPQAKKEKIKKIFTDFVSTTLKRIENGKCE